MGNNSNNNITNNGNKDKIRVIKIMKIMKNIKNVEKWQVKTWPRGLLKPPPTPLPHPRSLRADNGEAALPNLDLRRAPTVILSDVQ